VSSTPEPTDPVLAGDPPVLRVEGLRPRDELRRRATAAGATVLELEVPVGDAARAAVADGTRLLGERMTKDLPAEPQVPAGFTWRSLREDELEPWRERQVRLYAEDGLEGFGGDAELALADARADFARLLPDGLATPDTSLVVLAAGDERVGHLWVRHHRSPGLSYVYDVEVDEAHRGRGHGRAAMLVAERLARDAGDDVLGLHVFGFNTVARSLYRSLGYVLRSSTYDLLADAT
jgi:ribosomal protein S18 acetylase RimI-like enzyme